MVRDGHGQEYRQEVVATMPSRLEGARHPCSVEPGPGAFCPPGRRCRHQLAGVAAESAGHVGRSRDHPLARHVQGNCDGAAPALIREETIMSGTQHPSGGHEHAPAAHPAATPAPPSQAQAPAPVPLGHASSATEPPPPSGAQAPRRKLKPKPPKKAKPARARRKGTTANSRKAKRPASRRRRGGRR